MSKKYTNLVNEFMGNKKVTETVYIVSEHGRNIHSTTYYQGTGEVDIKEYSDKFTLEEMEYSTSWSWLMPVVKKCYETYLEYKNTYNSSKLEIDRFNLIDIESRFDIIGIYIKCVDIENTLSNIAKFIHELNKVKNGSNS